MLPKALELTSKNTLKALATKQPKKEGADLQYLCTPKFSK